MEDSKHASLRILMTADTVGGVWTYCMELCRTLRKFQVSFDLVTAGAPLQHWQREEAAVLENLTIHETEFPLEWMSDPWNRLDESADYLLKLEEVLQPDLIHLNSYSYGSLPFKAPRIVVAHSDVYSWWQSVKGEMPPADWGEYFKRVQQGIQQANLVIAPSQEMMKSIHAIYGVKSEHKVIYNGRTAGLFYGGQKQPFVLSMGRVWDEAKNIKLLLEASPAIRYSIRIAGDHQFGHNRFHTDIGNIHYLGKLTTAQVVAELSRASIYVLPARYEPFGLSALEAALSGCALVLGNIPSLREIWEDAALYVDPTKAAELAKTINQLMEDPFLLREYASRAAQRAKVFTAQSSALQYLEVYEQWQQQKKYIINTETV
jgi:glycosyltransferase involved in cell wall biosynthesis